MFLTEGNEAIIEAVSQIRMTVHARKMEDEMRNMMPEVSSILMYLQMSLALLYFKNNAKAIVEQGLPETLPQPLRIL